MKILIVGSGGREHALAWKFAQSKRVKKIYCAPGNDGMVSLAEIVPIKADDLNGLASYADKEGIDLTIVGPELPLTQGITDVFEKKGLKIFGPSKNASELEGSKVFAKQFMERHKIPTASSQIVDSPAHAKKLFNSGNCSFPVVIKADGLAGGKGVVICKNVSKAEEAVEMIMVEKKFGDSGKRILIEEFLEGVEASFIVISDGVKVMPLVTTMDHKKVFDGDKGPNTGGMGAISPSPFINQDLYNEIVKTIIFPSITRMLEEGRKFRGVLYVGLMLTSEGPKVLEYNCRFGDPETQVQMLRMESDLLDVIEAATEENVLDTEVRWSRLPSGCVVVCSGGYPTKYEKDKQIEGLDEAAEMDGIRIFHAGTTVKKGEYYTNGGRVLGVCSAEEDLGLTMNRIYEAIGKIYFEAMHYRRDIGELKGDRK